MTILHISAVENGYLLSLFSDGVERSFVFETQAKAIKLVKQFFNELNAKKNGDVVR